MQLFKISSLFLGILFLVLPKISFANQMPSDGFDYQVGKPDAKGYYNAQDFGMYNPQFKKYHLGEDWNRGSKDTDSGDPIFAISNGVVRYSKDSGLVWGRVIVVEHQLFDGSKFYSQYGHLNSSDAISENAVVVRGQQIATIRHGVQTNFGYMPAHLHFELRTDSNPSKIDDGPGYSATPKASGWLDPSDFIDAHRPISAVQLNAPTNITNNSLDLSWSQNNEANFKEYRILRSNSTGNYQGEPIKIISNRDETSFKDTGLIEETSYFYKVQTVSQTGLASDSNEVSAKTDELGGIAKNISNDPLHNDIETSIGKRFIAWINKSNSGEGKPSEIYVYDLQKKTKEMVASSKTDNINEPWVWDNASALRIAYKTEGKNAGIWLYEKNLASNVSTNVKLVGAPTYAPSIYENNVVYAADRLKNGQPGLDGYFELYNYNLSTKQETLIQNPEMSGDDLDRKLKDRPRIYGDTVIWTEYFIRKDGNNYISGFDVLSYNLLTGIKGIVSSESKFNVPEAEISGFNVVWTKYKENNNGKSIKGLSVYDVNTKKITTYIDVEKDKLGVLNYPQTFHSIAVSGNRIAYIDDFGRIMVIDIDTGKKTQILGEVPYKSPPQRNFINIYGDNLVWQELVEGGKYDIFYYRIPKS